MVFRTVLESVPLAGVAASERNTMPAYARHVIVADDEVGVYHCITRCVRRVFLCGSDPVTGHDYEHRKDWIRERLQQLSSILTDPGATAIERRPLDRDGSAIWSLVQTSGRPSRFVEDLGRADRPPLVPRPARRRSRISLTTAR